jgi:hypothetical protein
MVSFMALKTAAQVTVIRLPMVSRVFELTLLAACLLTSGQVRSRLRRLMRSPDFRETVLSGRFCGV